MSVDFDNIIWNFNDVKNKKVETKYYEKFNMVHLKWYHLKIMIINTNDSVNFFIY